MLQQHFGVAVPFVMARWFGHAFSLLQGVAAGILPLQHSPLQRWRRLLLRRLRVLCDRRCCVTP